MRRTSLRYMPGLDGLRALAVGLVFVSHCFAGTVQGVIGVDVFFVLSGFLITRILLGETARTGGIGLPRFYASRLLRLWPPLVVLVIAALILTPLEQQSLKQTGGDAIVALLYLSNVVKTVTHHPMAALGHTWSLAMEEQFYLLWPGLLLIMVRAGWTRRRMAFLATAAAALSLLGWLLFHGPRSQYDPLIEGPGALLLGCALALSTEGDQHALAGAWPAYAGAAVAVAATVAQIAGWVVWPASVIVTVAIVPVVAHVAFGDSPLTRRLAWRPLVFLGVISYEIYLTHFLILYVLSVQLRWTEAPTALLTLIGTLIASVAMHYGITRPVLRRRPQLIGRLGGHGDSPADAGTLAG